MLETLQTMRRSVRSRLTGVRDGVLDRVVPATAQAKLEAMAAAFNLMPSLRHHLRDEHPSGARFVFRATIEFATADGDVAVHAVFRDGQMRVHRGLAKEADTSLHFRTARDLRRFFAGEDTMGMLLDGGMQIKGNFAVLLKFAYMSAVISRRGRKARPRPLAAAGSWPSDWHDLPDPPPGEPCKVPLGGETEFLDDPYLSSVRLSDLPRIKRLLWTYRTSRPAVCSERARLLTEFALGHRSSPQSGGEPSEGEGVRAKRGREGKRGEAGAGEPPVLRQARGIAEILSRRTARIDEEDLLAGTTSSKRIGVIVFPELGGLGLWPELLTVPGRELNPYDISDEDIEILDRQVYPYWIGENLRDWTKKHAEDRFPLELDERFCLYFLWKTQAASHTVIDLPRALRRGLLDIQAEAASREQAADSAERRAFYASLRIALGGILDYAEHLADEAEHQLHKETDPERREVLSEMARICRKVPAHPPETLHEAIQALWTLFCAQFQENMGAGLVAGRLDLWFEAYYRRDLEKATNPAEKQRLILRALELCSALMIKLADHLPMVPDLGNRLFGGSSENHVITLGGVRADGSSAVNDLTFIFLKATELLRLRDPNVNARFAPGVNSEGYLRRLCEVNLLTHATPSLHNDAAMIPALQAQGFSLEHARDWTATGCVEPTSCGRHFGHTNCMMLNLVAPLEMALRNGVHPLAGAVGPHTGSAESFASYESFFRAYTEQLGWVIDRSVEANNTLGRAHQELKPTPLLSALFDGPMQKGRDVTKGGALYNSSGAAMIGLTDVIDSLSTIATLVFERRVLTLPELVRALEADFVGHEVLLAQVQRKVPKFGQDHELPQKIADAVQDFVFERYQSLPHYRGGRYVPGYWSMSNHVAFGLLSGALPSGRRRGQPFTPGLTPSPTAGASLSEQIHAVAALDPIKMSNNIAFNLKVVPGGDDTPERVLDRITALAGSYFELGGMQMQLNVTSSKVLRDAMEHPDRYGDLLVRISGYNAYFVELNRDIQLELVERAEHCLGS